MVLAEYSLKNIMAVEGDRGGRYCSKMSTWIAKRKPKIITTDHFPSYEEATVKYSVDIAEAKKKESDPEPGTALSFVGYHQR